MGRCASGDADPSAADWRRFGRLPGFTNCKPEYRKREGLFPFVRLDSHIGQQYPMAQAFEQEIAEVHATSMKRLSKVEATDDPSDGADDE
jgi:hypothetical protein